MSTPPHPGDSPLSSTGTFVAQFDRAAEYVTVHEWKLWVIVIVTLLLDVGTTLYGLEVGLTERNPVVNSLRPALGLLGTLVLLKGCVCLVGVTAWRTLPAKYRGLAPLGIALPWSLAVATNSVLLVSLHL